MGKPKVATVWLEGCAGCHMSFLDLDEQLLEVFGAVELTVSPITDFKDYPFPRGAVGVIEGAVGNAEQEEIVRHMREKCALLVAWGDCAVFGGVNTMRNGIPLADLLRRGYAETASSPGQAPPADPELPPLLDKVLSVSQVAAVDVHVPGCPPSPEAIAHALMEILQGRTPKLPSALLHFD